RSASSEIEDEPFAAAAGDADHHGLPCRALVRGQQRVTMVGRALKHVGLARAASALGTGVQHLDARGAHRLQHRGVLRHGEGSPGTGEYELEWPVLNAGLLLLGLEAGVENRPFELVLSRS